MPFNEFSTQLGEIATALAAIKWHTSNIYGKLGVKGRTQAVALARKINLIP